MKKMIGSKLSIFILINSLVKIFPSIFSLLAILLLKALFSIEFTWKILLTSLILAFTVNLKIKATTNKKLYKFARLLFKVSNLLIMIVLFLFFEIFYYKNYTESIMTGFFKNIDKRLVMFMTVIIQIYFHLIKIFVLLNKIIKFIFLFFVFKRCVKMKSSLVEIKI